MPDPEYPFVLVMYDGSFCIGLQSVIGIADNVPGSGFIEKLWLIEAPFWLTLTIKR